MCPSSPSAWQIWSCADPFPSLSKKLFYFVKKGLLQTAPKRDRRSRKGPPISFFAPYSLRCQPVIDRLSPLRPLLRSASGAAGSLCAKIIEAYRTQDCQLSRRPEEVLNVRNTPAKPLCKGPRAAFLRIACPAALTRCAIKCIFAMTSSLSFRNARHLRTKNGQTKAGCVPKDTPCQFI